MKICNNGECSVKFKCTTAVVKILHNTCVESRRPVVQSPNVQRVQASNRSEFKPPESKRLESKSPIVEIPSVQSTSIQSTKFQSSRHPESKRPESKRPDVQSPSVQCPSVQGSRVLASRVQASRPCVQSSAFPLCPRKLYKFHSPHIRL